MNYKFIQNIQIDWTKISPNSYLRNIPTLQFEDALVFEKNITFFDDGVIHECQYTETDSYQVTEMFINNREYLLNRLLRE